jgi:hypothetical protein
MPPAPVRQLGKTAIKRVAGLKPGFVPAIAASATAGTIVAVLTYRLLRSH